MDRDKKIEILKSIFSGKAKIDSLNDLTPGSFKHFYFKRISPIYREELTNDEPRLTDVFPFELFQQIDNGKIYTYQEIFSLHVKDPKLLLWHSVTSYRQCKVVGIHQVFIWGTKGLDESIVETMSVDEKQTLLGILECEKFSEENYDLLRETYESSNELLKRLNDSKLEEVSKW